MQGESVAKGVMGSVPVTALFEPDDMDERERGPGQAGTVTGLVFPALYPTRQRLLGEKINQISPFKEFSHDAFTNKNQVFYYHLVKPI